METITLQIPLFPANPDFRVFGGFKCNSCPHCGEQRTTDSIYGGTPADPVSGVSYLCGFSRRERPYGGIQVTVCQGDRYECYVPEESVA